MRLALKILVALVLGIAIGLGAAWWSLRAGMEAFDIRSGPWVTSRNVGSVDATDRERAIIAVRALLALTAREAIYFNATTDSEGEALDGGCGYRIAGGPLAARWWSVTAYGADAYLIPNADHAYSAGGNGAEAVEVIVGPQAGANGIVTRNGERFELTLRAYGPGEGLLTDPLPEIERISC